MNKVDSGVSWEGRESGKVLQVQYLAPPFYISGLQNGRNDYFHYSVQTS